MSESEASRVFHLYMQSSVKFDYFITGLTATVVAYFIEKYEPQRLGLDVASLEPLAIMFLVWSLVAGMMRIESTNIGLRDNFVMLEFKEYGLRREAKEIQDEINKTSEIGNRHYRRRNALLAVGFFLLLISKIFAPYS